MTYDAVAGQTFDNSQRVTPRFGLLWRPIPEVSIYGSYLTNFGASNVGYGQALAASDGSAVGGWRKNGAAGQALTATLAYYDLTKQHLPVPDPDPSLAAQGYYVAVGEVRNKGVELDVAGEILPGLESHWRLFLHQFRHHQGCGLNATSKALAAFQADPVNNPQPLGAAFLTPLTTSSA